MKRDPGTPADLEALKQELTAAASPADKLSVLRRLCDALWLAEPAQARPFLVETLGLAQTLGNHSALARAASMLAEVTRRAGDFAASERYTLVVLDTGRRKADQNIEASGFNLLGMLHHDQGRFDEAVECFEKCLTLSREAGFRDGELSALTQLGSIHAFRGRLERALECYRRCLDSDREHGDQPGQAIALSNVGWVLKQLGRWDEAVESLHRSIVLSEQAGLRGQRLNALNTLGEIHLHRDRPAEAIRAFTTVVTAQRENTEDVHLLIDALANLGRARFRSKDYPAAEQTYAEAMTVSAKAGARRYEATLCWLQAELALATGDLDRADALLTRADSLADELDLALDRAEVLRVRALLCAERGDDEHAAAAFEQAARLHSELGGGYELALVRLQQGRWLSQSGQNESAAGLLRQAARTFRNLAAVAESEQANRLLFQLELPADRETAVLEQLAALVPLGLEPRRFLDQALDMLCQALGFGCAAIAINRRPVILKGLPDFVTPRLLLPIPDDEKPVGLLLLDRPSPESREPAPGLLKVIIRMLTGPVTRLAELQRQSESELAIVGLRYPGVAGSDPQMRENLKTIGRVAMTTVPVLITGENGTGKELVARALHDSSDRHDRPFVPVNCAAVPEGLLEAEFFGVEKGAATGVVQSKGKFEQAQGGTILLDEIADMPPSLQAKLLRVLQEKVVVRVGGAARIPVDARVISSTNHDLEKLVAEGRFRQDLLYRINTVLLRIPPLRDRQPDIPAFVRYFITRSNQEYHRRVTGAEPPAMTMLVNFNWPGNVRQLQHVIERAVVLAVGKVLRAADLPPEIHEFEERRRAAIAEVGPESKGRRRRLAPEAQKKLLLDALEQSNWNVKKATALVGFSRAQVYRILKQHGIVRPKH